MQGCNNCSVLAMKLLQSCTKPSISSSRPQSCINTLRPRQNGCHCPNNIFKCNFLNENVSVSIMISVKFNPKGSVNNIPALVQIMAWCHPGDKPLSKPVMTILLTHICVAWSQWVNSFAPGDAYCINLANIGSGDDLVLSYPIVQRPRTGKIARWASEFWQNFLINSVIAVLKNVEFLNAAFCVKSFRRKNSKIITTDVHMRLCYFFS